MQERESSNPIPLEHSVAASGLFDVLDDMVFFIKDEHGRYVAVNETLVKRSGMGTKSELIGRTAFEVFPRPLGERYTAQDMHVLATAEPVRAELELHLYPNGNEGWCLTWKQPILNDAGKPIGLTGISRDLAPTVTHDNSELSAISRLFEHIRENLASPLSMEILAQRANLSAYQLDRRVRELYGVSMAQHITRARIDRSRYKLVHTDESIASIAIDCGYSDQTSFTRQFRQSVGMTPNMYREHRMENLRENELP